MEKWTGKTAVITGGCSGMGAAILSKFTKHGLKVINLDLNVTKNSLKFDENSKVFNRKCDVANLDSIRENFKWIEENFSVVHVLIKNAGIVRNVNVLDENSAEAVSKVIDVNFIGVVHCTREAAKLMKKSDDYCIIVNICSIAGHTVPFPNQLNIYPATKFAVRAFSEIVKQELTVEENDKIRVTNVSPGFVRTNLFNDTGFPEIDVLREKYKAKITEPKNIAEAVCYILSTPVNVNVTELTITGV
ncbi:hypothetical protein PVAND_015379 [Polypedilum vanderplanki]|uniref:Farnesol dehydrogenase-like n=1 Tax=Polypedilum vanderplanki TaxID=319348 RepID=A0A9J6BCV7_POLVA|nr:hypothetical protein PVAND_015379 [Polypedilum vanderplanki]